MKRIISIILILVLTISAFSGCNRQQASVDKNASKQERKPQLVVAMNPILAYENGINKIAFNDVKNAMSDDQKAASLTSLTDTTDWVWAYKQGEEWKKRGIYGLEKWRNGGYVSTDRLNAYSFFNDGTISLMPYTTAVAELTTYQSEEPPAAGILLSASGKEEEAFCLQITESGTIGIPTGKITAIQSVGGVKTGFLAEDGTERSAVIKFIVNTREIWSGELCNSTAGDGTAVTELTYPDIPDIEVKAGDIFFISMKLDAKLNMEEDLITEEKPQISIDNSVIDKEPEKEVITQISLMNGYDSRFRIIFPEDATITEKQIITKMRSRMVDIFEADVLNSSDAEAETDYEILIGLTNRKESIEAYNELTDYRANNGADFIIRMDGNKLVIAANTDYSLQLAVDYFMANYCKSDKDSVPSNLSYVSRPELGNIVIGDANIAAYTIRTEKYPSIMTVRAAEEFAEYVVAKTGYNLKIEKDTVTTENEILIGLTTRSNISSDTFKSASLDFLSGKKGNTYNNEDYSIFIDGTKLFVEAGSDYAASHAVLKLIEQLEENSLFAKTTSLSGSYNKGDYTLIDKLAYTWGDEFYTSSGTTYNRKNWKIMEKGYTESNGPWYEKSDLYYLASKASLEDGDLTNDFGGPWLTASDSNYVQEGTIKNLSSNVMIRNNMLVQISKKDINGYSGSIICTDGRMEFRYGILEARIMAATANGNAAAFWTRTKDGGSVVNEMDIYENFGEDKLRPNLHTWAETHTDHGDMITLRETCEPTANETFDDTFHHLALEWTPDFINMYLDGEIYLSQEITSDTWYAFKETTYVIFSNAAPAETFSSINGNPGNWLAGGTVDPMEAAKLFDTNNDGIVNVEDFYEEQLIDYIRLYQINSGQYSLKAKK